MRPIRISALCVAAIVAAACSEAPTSPSSSLGAPTLRFGHESNNRAELSGLYSGSAIINYVAGTEGWRSNVALEGELLPGTYSFFATGPLLTSEDQLICTFVIVDSDSRAGCSSDADLAGFSGAKVEYQDGTIVASGTFQRRGGNREKP